MLIDRWLSAFDDDPQKAVNDLFSGRAGLGSSPWMDTPELLWQEFPCVPEFAKRRNKLDEALFAWFTAMRKDYSRQIDRLGFAVYSKDICDCLISVQLLDLPMFSYQLRQGLDSWLRWLTPLRVAPERDPALECWRLLGRQQEDRSFVPAWLRLAADGRPEYLDVALFGLQGCSEENKQVLMLVAVMVHESACCINGGEATARFKRQYAALRGLYSLNPEVWQQNLESALAVFRNRAQDKVARELHQILSEKSGKRAGRSKPKVFPVNTAERESLLHALQTGKQQDAVHLAERFFKNQDQNLRFAEQTGNSYFFARTLSAQGAILLKQYNLSVEIMRRLERMIEQGLAWEPYNPFVWMLWADWHAKKKQFQQREWILREAVRLFPEHEASRVELARLLINRGEEHWDEAEHWLREVIERHSDNEPSRVELARLLIQRGEEHWDEAEHWLREAAERNPNHEPSRVELARLLIQRGEEHWDEAEKWLRQVIDRHPDNEPSRVELARLLIQRGEEHWDEAEKWLRQVAERNPKHGHSHLVWASLLAKRNKHDEAITLLEGFIARTGGNAHIVGFVERLRTGQTIETDETAEDVELSSEIESEDGEVDVSPASDEKTEPDSTDTAPTGLERIMEDIEHRASLQTQFMRSLSGMEDMDTCDNLRRLSEQGDTLAGFLQQWLRKDAALEIPPNAWAWRACRLYQQGTEEEWQQLEQECTDKTAYTRFLRLQAEETPSDNLLHQVSNWIARKEEDRSTHPLDRYIVSAHQQLTHSSPDQSERDAVVFAVCNAAAADAPEIS